jgi:hypothetical protein
MRAVLLGIATVVLVGMIAVALVVRQRSTNGPTCSRATSQLSRIEGFFVRGQLGVVVQESEHLLSGDTSPALCTSAHDQAAGYWYQSRILPLVSSPRPLSQVPIAPWALHQTALAWVTIEHQADVFGVPAAFRLPAKLVATMAFNEGQLELAATAFRRAWGSQIDHTDLGSVARYSQILTSWGRLLSLPAFLATRVQGVQNLATANSIVTAYGLADQRPCQALHDLGYNDCTRVAPDASDPVLAAATQ